MLIEVQENVSSHSRLNQWISSRFVTNLIVDFDPRGTDHKKWLYLVRYYTLQHKYGVVGVQRFQTVEEANEFIEKVFA